jgi:hypothetical protein
MPSTYNSWTIERHDQEDGSITYEIWDHKPPTCGRICSINTHYDNPQARNFAKHIVKLQNEYIKS